MPVVLSVVSLMPCVRRIVVPGVMTSRGGRAGCVVSTLVCLFVTTHALQPSLKCGVVVIEAAEVGVENTASVGERPVAVAHRVIGDPTVEAAARIFDKGGMSVLFGRKRGPKWRQILISEAVGDVKNGLPVIVGPEGPLRIELIENIGYALGLYCHDVRATL